MGSARQKRILLVEDTRAIAMMALRLVKAASGLEVDHAESLAEARKFLTVRADQYELALLDLTLPDAPDGEIVETCQQYNIPSIVFSGTSDEKLRQELFGAGVIDFVIKDSFSAVVYLSRLVKQLLQNKRIKVLLAGDDFEEAGFHAGLVRRLQFSARIAGGEQEVFKAIEETPDLALIFVGPMIGGAEGVNLIRKIREKYGRERLALIGLPGEDRAMASRYIKNGADDCIIEPATPEEFYSRINSAMETCLLLRELDFAAHHDFLTGCLNRRSFFDRCDDLHAGIQRSGQVTSLMMVDIDHFKSINDTYGHALGDEVISALGKYLLFHSPPESLVARFGGEEFCILSNTSGIDETRQWLDGLLKEISDMVIGEEKVGFTISAGVVLYGEKTLDIDELVRIADEQLYHSKENGRNQFHLVTEGGL